MAASAAVHLIVVEGRRIYAVKPAAKNSHLTTLEPTSSSNRPIAGFGANRSILEPEGIALATPGATLYPEITAR